METAGSASFWYPPRVLRQECAAKVDAAPDPFALASYVPGEGALGDTDQMVALDLMSSAVVVGVQVQLFDEAEQRDAYLATTLDFYRDPTFTCGGQKTSVQTFRESELRTERVTAVVLEAKSALLGGGVRGYAAVGDRILLVVSVSSDAVDAPWSPDDVARWLGASLEVALDRLDVAELP